MPLYEVEHVVPLNDGQKEHLAQSITHVHSRLFTTPSLFVNVRFAARSSSHDQTFVGGKRRPINRILAHVRSGPDRSPEDYNQLCDLITTAWNRVVDDASTARRPTELHGVYIIGSILAGTEAGFGLPPAGEDRQWLAANLNQFRERAKYGDQDFRDLLVELANRRDLQIDDEAEDALGGEDVLQRRQSGLDEREHPQRQYEHHDKPPAYAR